MNSITQSFESAMRALQPGAQEQTCLWVKERLQKHGKHLKEVFPNQISRDLNFNNEDEKRDIFKALDVLSLNSIGILEVCYELYESDDVLGMPTPIPPSEVLEALKTGILYSPKTGVGVPNFSKQLAIVYKVRDLEK